MLRGLYTSAMGMTTQMSKLDVVSNNIANVNTAGYKKDNVVTQSFSQELMNRLNDSPNQNSLIAINKGVNPVGNFNQGLFIDSLNTDFTNGSLKATNSALDLAISGGGFFTVQTTDNNGEAQTRYSRDGALTRSGNGTLVTKDGFVVMGENGAISLPDGNISISQSGQVYVGGEYIDTLKMVDFEDKTLLRKQGDSLYEALDGAGQKPFTSAIEQGFLESSNVNSVREMVEIIEVSRAYEANQRMVTTHDSTLAKAVSEIAKK